jgi:hypothetical protein
MSRFRRRPPGRGDPGSQHRLRPVIHGHGRNRQDLNSETRKQGVCRVSAWGRPHALPSELSVRLSPHSAQARAIPPMRDWRRAPRRMLAGSRWRAARARPLRSPLGFQVASVHGSFPLPRRSHRSEVCRLSARGKSRTTIRRITRWLSLPPTSSTRTAVPSPRGVGTHYTWERYGLTVFRCPHASLTALGAAYGPGHLRPPAAARVKSGGRCPTEACQPAFRPPILTTLRPAVHSPFPIAASPWLRLLPAGWEGRLVVTGAPHPSVARRARPARASRSGSGTWPAGFYHPLPASQDCKQRLSRRTDPRIMTLHMREFEDGALELISRWFPRPSRESTPSQGESRDQQGKAAR